MSLQRSAHTHGHVNINSIVNERQSRTFVVTGNSWIIVILFRRNILFNFQMERGVGTIPEMIKNDSARSP